MLCVRQKGDLDILSQGLEVLAHATRMVFARVYQQGEDAAKTKREVCARMGMLARHYSDRRADVHADSVAGRQDRASPPSATKWASAHEDSSAINRFPHPGVIRLHANDRYPRRTH